MTKESRVPRAKSRLRSSSDAARIASSLVHWSSSPLSSPSGISGQNQDETQSLLEAVEAAILARTLRPDHIPGELLLDPAWDMLLELFRVEIGGDQATASRLSKAAGVTTSSALRWVDALVAKGLCLRGDRADQGRMTVTLSPRGSAELRSYFGKLMRPLAP